MIEFKRIDFKEMICYRVHDHLTLDVFYLPLATNLVLLITTSRQTNMNNDTVLLLLFTVLIVLWGLPIYLLLEKLS